MKFKKNWKRFWTLDRHHAEGFTLVELIVVIAILAILGGVAVPAYSGYVKKANMAADQTLVNEVANALVLAYYNGTMTGDGYVVLSDATPEFGGNAEVETALKDTFGDGWEALTLSYDGWSGGSSSEVIGILQTQGASAAEAVAGSTYANNVSQLLNDAQNCTSTLAKFLGNFTGGNMEESFTKLEGNSQGLASVLAQAGLAKTEDGLNYDLIDADSVTNTQLSNALVLAIAGEVGNKADAQTSISDAWMSAAITGEWENTGMSVLADTAVRYAYYESITKSLNDSSLNTAFSTMNTAFSSATSEDAVYAAMGAMDSAIKNYMTAYPDGNSALDNYFGNQLATDAQALSSVMGAVDGVSDSFADSKILAQDNMYLSDNVANTVNSYVTAAKNYGSFPEGVEDGTVMIIFSFADAKALPVPNVY